MEHLEQVLALGGSYQVAVTVFMLAVMPTLAVWMVALANTVKESRVMRILMVVGAPILATGLVGKLVVPGPFAALGDHAELAINAAFAGTAVAALGLAALVVVLLWKPSLLES